MTSPQQSDGHRPDGHRSAAPAPGDEQPSLPCPYCDEPIEAATFRFMSPTRMILRTSCPGCARQVHVSAAHWRRLGGQLGVIRPF